MSRSTRPLAWTANSVAAEIEHVVACARRGSVHIVSLGPLVLFSARSGDAWMLDPEDTLALPLARSGEAQRSRILETATKFVVEWTHLYAINGEAFVVVDEETGRVMTILGYEVDDVAKACDDARRSGSCCPKSSMR